MAGVMALINQKVGTPQGNPNAELYSLGAKQNYANCSAESVTVSSSCYFNDVDTGTNAMLCKPTMPNCTVATAATPWQFFRVTVRPPASMRPPAWLVECSQCCERMDGRYNQHGNSHVTVTPTSITVAQGLSVAVNVSSTTGTPTAL